MRMIKYIVVFLLVSSIVNAQDFNSYESLDIKTTLSSQLNVDYVKSSPRLDYVVANLTFFPINNEFQDADISYSSNPIAEITFKDDSILYKWEDVEDNKLIYNLNADISTRTNLKKIKEKVKFPISNTEGLEEYVKESKTVTSNDPNIRRLASELAEGEDDLFIVVSKIAVWTKNNINYSLETLTEKVSQDASWVLENRKGVCDELTSLFVAMLRSINIPARFVTGQAYTSVFEDFGNHAWAEVYFPGYGWVPFDPTYGQIGYVDSTHISMKDSIDVSESSVVYSWFSYGVEISTDELNVKSKVVNKGELHRENVDINLRFLEENVGGGSYVPIRVQVKNPNDYYLPLNVFITKAPKKIENKEEVILLKPFQVKNLFFIIEIPEDLEINYVYTSSVEVSDNFQNSDSEEIKFGEQYDVVSFEEANSKILKLQEEDEKIYSANIETECSKDKEFYYKYENIYLSCNFKNIGNVILDNLDLCYLDQCEKVNLDIGEEMHLDIDLKATDVEKELLIELDNENVAKNVFFDLNILKDPNLTITSIDYPENVDYSGDYKISFVLNSDSEIKDVVIKLGDDKVFDIPSLKDSNDFSIDFKGDKFYNKEQDLSISYKDLNDNPYSINQEININVNNIPFYVKYYWIFIIIFVIIISMILRKKLHH